MSKSIARTALPLILASTVLAGCAGGVQKSDWPVCAAVGALVGGAAGATQSGNVAGMAALGIGTTAGAYCWVHGKGNEQVARMEPAPAPTPAPAPAPAPAPLPKQEVITARDLHFAFDSAAIDAQDRAQLDGIAGRLRGEAASTRLSITGHTDSKGTDAYNQRLSERRAKSVSNYLIQAGVPAASIVSVKGMGERQPIATNETAEGRATNRRVEIQIDRE